LEDKDVCGIEKGNFQNKDSTHGDGAENSGGPPEIKKQEICLRTERFCGCCIEISVQVVYFLECDSK
jgi:hypothetical protein